MRAAFIAQLLDALNAEAAQALSAPSVLASLTVEWLEAPAEGEETAISATVSRATRTLIFTRAEARSGDGRLLVFASAVHRV